MAESTSITSRTGFLRWDRLHPLLQQRLGEGATRPEMADHLGIGYITFWRLTSNTNGRRYPASEQVVAAVLATFSDQTFENLFEADGLPARRRRIKAEKSNAERLYTVQEAADLWSCSKNDIYKLIHQGKLPTVNLGVGKAKMRVSESALAAYLAAADRAKSSAA